MAFPTSPSNDDLHTEFGRTFKYSSVSNSWSVATPDAPEDNALTTQGYVDVQSLPLTGVAAGSKAFVQDGNKLFIFTGSGWFEIATINTAPTITSGADATYALNSDGTPTVITLQATDPEGTPIIWGYQVTSGSLEDTTITNEGGVFTITPGTTEATFNLTFTASDGVNIDTSASSFTLAFGPDWSTAILLHTLDNPNAFGPGDGDNFGISVAMSGNYAIVGAYGEDDSGGGESGKAYVFDVTTGALVSTLNNPNAYGTSANDQFGRFVSISGNYAIVSTHNEGDAGGTSSGKAYIFNATTGALVHTLNNPNAYSTSAGDQFSDLAVAISGNYAIVGAFGEDDAGGGSSGKAYIFDVTTGAVVYTLNNPNAFGTSATDQFGYSVGISGNYAIVGARTEDDAGGTDSGKAYIFNTVSGDWTDASLSHTLDNPNAYDTSTNDLFSYSVAIDGNYTIVSAVVEDDAGGLSSGKAYIFDVTTGTLLHTLDNPNAYGTSAGDDFGRSVGISGNYAIVSTINEDDAGGTQSGKAYIFNVTTGALLRTLDNPNPWASSSNDNFGMSAAISGNSVIVGAWLEDADGGYPFTAISSGRAYIFQAS